MRRKALDRSTHIELARLYLDQDRLEEARQALDKAEAASGDDEESDSRSKKSKKKTRGNERPDPRVIVQKARLALKEQRYDDVVEQLEQAIEDSRWLRTAETYALLAVAAHGAGRDEDCEDHMEKARTRGVDVAVLDELRSPAPSRTSRP